MFIDNNPSPFRSNFQNQQSGLPGANSPLSDQSGRVSPQSGQRLNNELSARLNSATPGSRLGNQQQLPQQVAHAAQVVRNLPYGTAVYRQLLEMNTALLNQAVARGVATQTNFTKPQTNARVPLHVTMAKALFGHLMAPPADPALFQYIHRGMVLGQFDPDHRDAVEHTLRTLGQAGVINDHGMYVQLTFAGYAIRKHI